MTSGGNNFNDFPENQLTKLQLGGKHVTILHTVISRTISILFVHGRKTGHLASREAVSYTHLTLPTNREV